ncbi:MAG: SdrD B-like domain-containing protein [Actinomycetota bacterium]|nr:SdrD B-like domain-containing protein [Actinomycetota bacterium]
MERSRKWLALISITVLVLLSLLGGIISASAAEGQAASTEEQIVTEDGGNTECDAQPGEATADESSQKEEDSSDTGADEENAAGEDCEQTCGEEETGAKSQETAPLTGSLSCCEKGSICGTKYLYENGQNVAWNGGQVKIVLDACGIHKEIYTDPVTNSYCFEGLDLDITYTVSEEVSGGYYAVDPSDESHEGITLTRCHPDETGVDFVNAECTPCYCFIEGWKLKDDGKGNTEAWDEGVDGPVNITLTPESGTPVTVSTSGGGYFSFGELEPGTYTVSEEVPGGYTQTFPESGSHVVDLECDTTVTVYFHNAPIPEPACDYGVLDVLVYEDLNCDGIFDSGEPLIVGEATLELYHADGTPADGYDGSYQKQTGSGAYGMWAPWGVFPAPYPTGWAGWMNLPLEYDGQPFAYYTLKMTSWPEGYTPVFGTVIENIRFACPVCYWNQIYIPLCRCPGSITGLKYEDMGADGIKDPDDPLWGDGEPTVTVELWKDALFTGMTAIVGSDGSFTFDDVEPGDGYEVKEVLPEGVYSNASTIISGITVTSGEETVLDEEPFLNYLKGSITGLKYEDMGADGIKDPDDPLWGDGEPTVTVELWKDALFTGMTAIVGSDGSFTFDDVEPGDGYEVKEVLPEGVYSNASTIISGITVTSGEETVLDEEPFLNYLKGSICGWKYWDKNENGIFDEGDEPLVGVTIELYEGEPVGDPIATCETDVEGRFRFDDLNPGIYTVVVDESTAVGYYPTSDFSIEVEIESGQHEEVYFSESPYASISGTKWLDANMNAIWDDNETMVIEGITVKLYKGDPQDELVAEDVTGEDGTYTFTDLEPGTYTVMEEGKEGYFSCTPDSVVLPLSAGEGAIVDFGNCPYGRVEGLKFEDLDGNGSQDANEIGLEGVTITLTGEGEIGAMAVTTTGEDGTFFFNNLMPGDYIVAETVPEGYYATRPISVDVVVGPAESINVVFANALYASLSGHKWQDNNGSGTYDTGEPPVEGVTITLYGESLSGETVDAKTATASDGSYSFLLVEAGSYTISEIVPENMTATSDASIDKIITPGDDITDVDFHNSVTDVGGEVVTPEGESSRGGTLPYTGMKQLPLLILAGLLVLLGLAVLAVGFRRRYQE